MDTISTFYHYTLQVFFFVCCSFTVKLIPGFACLDLILVYMRYNHNDIQHKILQVFFFFSSSSFFCVCVCVCGLFICFVFGQD